MMSRNLVTLFFVCLASVADAEKLHVRVVGAPEEAMARGIDLGRREMDQTARLLGSELTVSAAAADAGARLVGSVVVGTTPASLPAGVPAIRLGDGEGPPGRCGFRIRSEINDAGKTTVAWLPSLDRYGASDLNERFQRLFHTPMTASAWSGWFAVKALVESALRGNSGATACDALTRARFDGHKGTPLFFDPDTRELQQPMYAFVSNELAETVSVIDVARDEVVRTMKVPGRPRGIEAFGTVVHVALSDTNRERRNDRDAIVTLDGATGKMLARYEAGSDPERFVVSKDGRRLFAANEDAGTATVTDLATNRMRATLVVGVEPEGVALSPDGRWVYVTAETSNTVSVIDTVRLKVVSSMLVDPRPRAAAFSPDGARAYVTSEIGGSLSIIDSRRHKVIDVVALPPPAKPVGVAVSPDGRMVYVANGHANSVAFVDASSLKIVATIPVGKRPWGVAVSPDGKKLYTANGISGDVSVIDTATRRELKRIATGAGAWGVAITPPPSRRGRRASLGQ